MVGVRLYIGVMQKTAPGEGFRIWYQCESFLHQFSTLTESCTEDSEDEFS